MNSDAELWADIALIFAWMLFFTAIGILFGVFLKSGDKPKDFE